MRYSKLRNVAISSLALILIANSIAASNGVSQTKFSDIHTQENQLTINSIDQKQANQNKQVAMVNRARAIVSEMSTREMNRHTDISECLMIGDSNTVRMSMYDTGITAAAHISAIVGVGVGGWETHTHNSNTTHGLTLKRDLEKLSNTYFDNVIIMLGTNDYNKEEQEFVEQYTEILDYIHERNNSARVYMVTVPPVNDKYSPSIDDADADKISKFVRDLANGYSKLETRLIDLNSYLSSSDMSNSYGDGYHFSESGAIKAADYIIDNL